VGLLYCPSEGPDVPGKGEALVEPIVAVVEADPPQFAPMLLNAGPPPASVSRQRMLEN
jgi:hypothetical protein